MLLLFYHSSILFRTTTTVCVTDSPVGSSSIYRNCINEFVMCSKTDSTDVQTVVVPVVVVPSYVLFVVVSQYPTDQRGCAKVPGITDNKPPTNAPRVDNKSGMRLLYLL